MSRVTAIIPARLHSTRFPRKVLYLIKGKPLIYYVWRSVVQSRRVDRVYVATDSKEIGRAVNAFGGAVIMTSAKPRNGTERTAEAVMDFKSDIIVNVQADNLGLTGAVIDRVIDAMTTDRAISYATLARKVDGSDALRKLDNYNVVKVIQTADGHAGWFSRLPIPHIHRPGQKGKAESYSFLEHIGVYFYRKGALLDYLAWPRAASEKAESLEQLRILEHGGKIRLFTTRVNILSVDSEQALEKIHTVVK